MHQRATWVIFYTNNYVTRRMEGKRQRYDDGEGIHEDGGGQFG